MSEPRKALKRVDLAETRDLSDLFGLALRVWGSHPAVFLSVAIVLVVPVELIVVGVIGGGFGDRYGQADQAVGVVDSLLVNLVLTALVTACHARTVVLISGGDRVTVGRALSYGFAAFTPVLVTGVVVGVLTFIGFLLIIIPGIFLSVALLFATQFAALSKTSPWKSVEASMALVQGNGWWRTFGYSLMLTAVPIILLEIVAVIVAAIVDSAGDGLGPVWVVGEAFVQAAILSWTALVGTLLYFNWRARAGEPYGTPEGEHQLLSDAGPDWRPATES